MMSHGISRNAGPGRPVVMARKALAMYCGSSSARSTRWAYLVMGRNSATCSVSCSAPLVVSACGAAPPISSTGDSAALALAMPVMASVTPGPAVTTATPMPRVRRA